MIADPETQSELTVEQRKQGRKFFAYPALALLVGVVFRETFGARTTLVTHVPVVFNWIAGLIGMALGIMMVWQLMTSPVPGQSKLKKYFVATMIIPLVIVTCTYLGRWVFELAAFVNVQPEPKLTQVKILEAHIKGRSAGFRLEALAAPDGREFEVFVTERVNAELSAIRPPLWRLSYAHQQNCLLLPLELGRWGMVRARVPALWDEGIDQYILCDATPEAGHNDPSINVDIQ